MKKIMLILNLALLMNVPILGMGVWHGEKDKRVATNELRSEEGFKDLLNEKGKERASTKSEYDAKKLQEMVEQVGDLKAGVKQAMENSRLIQDLLIRRHLTHTNKPIHWAALAGDYRMMSLLFEEEKEVNKIDVNEPGEGNLSPFNMLYKSFFEEYQSSRPFDRDGFYKCATLLKNHGADRRGLTTGQLTVLKEKKEKQRKKKIAIKKLNQHLTGK